MPLAHAVVSTSVWADEAWVALTGAAQRFYWLLLSQQKLSLIGTIDYLPSRWARMAADTSLDSIEAAVDELEASRFIVVDHDTDELLIRTFVRHDIEKVQRNQNLLRGLWNAWAKIESRQLRLESLRNIPASVWTDPRCQPHPEATQIRRSGALEPAVPTRSSNPQLGPSLIPDPSSRNATADSKQPGNSRGDGPSAAAAVDKSRLSDEERQLRLDDAIELLVTRELERTPTRTSRRRHAGAVRNGKRNDHHQAGHQALVDDPTLTPELLADLLEPPGAAALGASRGKRDDPDDAHQRADRARHQRDQDRYERDVLDAPQADPASLRAGLATARARLRPVAGGHP